MRLALCRRSAVLLAAALAALSHGNFAQTPAAPQHTVVSADGIQWKPLRPGAEIAVISGDPDKSGSPFVMRFRYRGQARIPPHWHPIDEHITVLSGTFKLGMGSKGDEAATTVLAAGGYAFVEAKMAHYGWTDGDTTLQVHGVGPFVINYVNPADDPKSGKK